MVDKKLSHGETQIRVWTIVEVGKPLSHGLHSFLGLDHFSGRQAVES